MRVLGIDPGMRTVGWGIVDGDKDAAVSFGVVELAKTASFSERLGKVHKEIEGIIGRYNIGAVAIEEPFFAKSVGVAMRIGQVAGVVMLAAVESNALVAGYTPVQVKQSVVGYGRAGKEQVQHMVRTILHMDSVPEPHHASDALAVAICHLSLADQPRRAVR